MRKFRIPTFLIICMMFFTSFCSFSFASDDDITINKPSSGTYYKGETIPFDFQCYDSNSRSGDLFIYAELYKSGKTYEIFSDNPFTDEESYYTYTGTRNANEFAAGTYKFRVELLNYDSTLVGKKEKSITIATLKAPTKLKAKAGKKKVTITYKKAAGATSYEIYRATKKKGEYQLIKTTKKTKYIDRKVKKGKKYYYKVRTKRIKNDTTIYSSYRGPIKTKKVKR